MLKIKTVDIMEGFIMVPSIFGENMLDDFFDGGFFGAHNPLYGKNGRILL